MAERCKQETVEKIFLAQLFDFAYHHFTCAGKETYTLRVRDARSAILGQTR